MDGKVNASELLINVVKADKPKRLIGLSQKARGQVQKLAHLLSQMTHPRRTGKT